MKDKRLVIVGLLMVIGVLGVSSVSAAPVLSAGSFWRSQISFRPAVTTAGESIGLLAGIQTAPPPATWADVNFDDSSWIRTHGPFPGNLFSGTAAPTLATLYLRGEFIVTDVAAVNDLTLSLTYRGGVVVYLNGKKLKQQDLPAEVTSVTAATAYGKESYVSASGKRLPSANDKNRINKLVKKEPGIQVGIDARTRKLEAIKVPADLLVKGVNVIAIESHASDFLPESIVWKKTKPWAGWPHFGLYSFHLTAAGEGVAPNVERGNEFQVWNADINQTVDPRDYGYCDNKVKPMRIVGAKNGSYSAQ
ncbi:MAG: hypothetical protein KAI74_06295, partial [Kiritimatiellae bacterium]|nr:hypothetical protein [Kiritimatiellia bacterium]